MTFTYRKSKSIPHLGIVFDFLMHDAIIIKITLSNKDSLSNIKTKILILLSSTNFILFFVPIIAF